MIPALSIIIPHYRRPEHLWHCLRRIDTIALPEDIQVVIVSADDPPLPQFENVYKAVVKVPETCPFNKSVAMNAGIDAACGDVLMFLDCDMLLGDEVIPAILDRFYQPAPPTRLCFRVHKLPTADPNQHLDPGAPLAYEAYGTPDTNYAQLPQTIPKNALVFGNSQFAIHRLALGSIHFDEGYSGKCFQDLDFIQQIWQAHGASYRGEILTDSITSLYHLHHDNQPYWADPYARDRNLARYQAKWPS